MSLNVMFRDELKGFAKSKVMLALWIGMPVLTLLIHAFQPKMNRDISLMLFSTFVVASVSGTLSSIMLTVSIIHEKSRGVYPLFLVRPVKRRSILLGKFLAVFSCIAVAALITVAAGLVYDTLRGRPLDGRALVEAGKSVLVGFAGMGISSAAGILIGVLAPSVLVGVILVLYGGNQISSLGLLPSIFNFPSAWLFSLAFGAIVTGLLLFVADRLFEKKQF